MSSLLQRFFNIRRGEATPILLAALYFFCILTALMVLRPAREALGMQRGIEAIRWLFMGTLVLTLLVNPVFGLLVSLFRRLVFITLTHAFFALNLVGFYLLLVLTPQAVGETTGQVFYVWMSVFNLFITMVFWALMADRFTLEQSKRIFGVIAVGGTAGAIAGSALATLLVSAIGTPALLLIAAGFLMAATAMAWGVARLQPDRPVQEHAPDSSARVPADRSREASPEDRAVIGGSAWQGFRAVAGSPYLLGISAYVLILAVLVTFVYFTRLQMVAALGDEVDMRTGIFARIDLITQTATLVLQAIVAGHIMRRLGVHVALALAPLVVAAGFIGLAVVGTLTALIAFDATFRAFQRAIMRPARETLFTVVSREDKYKAKAFIDTFVYRGGDAVGAQVEGVLGRIGIGLAALASFAVPLAVLWAGLGVWLGLAQRRLAQRPPPHELRAQPTGSVMT
jgi:ATP:ADP antiporter, AAA family